MPGAVSTENDPLPTDGLVGGRGRTVNAILGLAARGCLLEDLENIQR